MAESDKVRARKWLKEHSTLGEGWPLREVVAAMAAFAQSERDALPCGHDAECGIAYADKPEIVCVKCRVLKLQSERQAGWVSVEERLPDTRRIVDVWDDGFGISYTARCIETVWEDCADTETPRNVTHWRERPPAPDPAPFGSHEK